MVVDVIMFCLQFYDKEWLNPMAFWCVTLVCYINILIAMPSIFKCNSVSRKIGFFAFAVVMTFVAAAIVFYVVWLVISIILGIWFLKGLWHVLNEPPMTSSGSAAMASVSGGSGGSASGGSGDILLSNGDTVRYDAMTGDYRSTNPTVDNYYKKDGNDFVQR